MSKFASNRSGSGESSEHMLSNASAGGLNGTFSSAETVANTVGAAASVVDDELSTRLFSAVVSVVEDRRQIAVSLEEYKRQLRDASETIEELKQEKRAAQSLVERKEEEIEISRRQIAEKQLKYDQLMEDYKQLRANDAKEFERLQDQVREVRLNYENLSADYSRFRTDSMKEVEKLEAELRGGMVRYHQLLEKFNKVKEENARLTAHIMNFAQQMTTLRGGSAPIETIDQAVPIQPVVHDHPSDGAGE